MRRILCILALTAIVLISTVAAAPVLPDEFYGSVYLNGNPAPAGTVIVAKINGESRGELTTMVDGVYGGPGNYELRLMVSSTEEEVNAGNTSVTFFVGGVQAFQIVPFKSGNSEKLDLMANNKAFDTSVTTLTTYSSSGSSSGGSSGGGGGYLSSSSGTGISGIPGITIKSTAVAIPAANDSRSSINANIDAPQTTPSTTVIVTPGATTLPAVTTVPTTKKAGAGPLSVVFLAVSIIAVLSILSWTDYTRKRR